ncbi:NAD(P)/FAD-dependent oxidoreductase [Nakamurella lactea]|uniref:NAD(P)/FAD-dependent oxidoreductase n=1 Tax=Nakamurella lactea TaxID=459515 RepID=UPI0004919DAD|nr:FAD-dependent oxidoreductase [Nakamurella lactea]
MATNPGCIVVGAGLAAANVVESLRDNGFDGSITLIGDELDRPYERPPLSKDFLQGKADRDSVFVHGQSWYTDHDITARFGDTVASIDRAAQTVTLATGDTLEYRQLVLATGSSPRRLDVPGAELAGVHTLRRIGDSEQLRAGFTDGARVVLIGAGWIGLELAAAARLAGCAVTVLEFAPLPLQRVLGDELAGYFAELHRAHQVDLRLGIGVTEIVGSGGTVTGVRAGDELFDADLVVVGVGAKPNTELAKAAGLEVDNGVLVDERLRTSDPRIWAVGDVASATNTALGRRIRVEHWDNAIRQGKLAGSVIAGGSGSFDWQPYFYTDQFDLGMEYVGYADAADQVVIRGDKSTGEFIAFWVNDGTVRAAMNVNIWDVNDDLRALTGRQIAADRLADTGIPLTEL